METITKVVGYVVIFAITVAIVTVLFGLPVMWLWNWLMPYLFGLPTITLGQAIGLELLCGFLFKPIVLNKSK